MQDYNQEFDLQIRSILEKGEIKPRKGVWKKISARLDEFDEAQVSQVYRPVYQNPAFRWAGAALSFAVLVVGIFIVLPNRTQKTVSRGPLVADRVELIVPEIGEAAVLDETLDRNVSTNNIIQDEDFEPTLSEPILAATELEPTLSEPALSATESKPVLTATESEPQIEIQEKSSAFSDPFAELINDDWNAKRKRSGRKSGGVSLYAQGAIGSNDADLSGRSSIAHLAPSSSNSSGFSESSTSTYGIPLTLGFGARIYFLPRLSIGIGLDYSLLTRTFTGTYSEEGQSGDPVSGEVRHTMQYLGVPVELFYDVLRSDKIKFYVYGGGEAEYCISNEYSMYHTSQITSNEPVNSLQYSVGGGIGVEFSLMRNFGIYFDPGVKYYFPNGHPKSIRTDKPLMFSFDAGLRFRL